MNPHQADSGSLSNHQVMEAANPLHCHHSEQHQLLLSSVHPYSGPNECNKIIHAHFISQACITTYQNKSILTSPILVFLRFGVETGDLSSSATIFYLSIFNYKMRFLFYWKRTLVYITHNTSPVFQHKFQKVNSLKSFANERDGKMIHMAWGTHRPRKWHYAGLDGSQKEAQDLQFPTNQPVNRSNVIKIRNP